MIDQVQGFHIEPTNICTLRCNGCARTRFIQQWPQHWKNHSLNVDHLLNFLDIDLQDKKFELCGNYGDPIYHPDFVEFVTKIKQTGAVVNIVTNGSYRTRKWWQQLTEVLDHRDSIKFSIDGTPENFTQYRENADWLTIKQGIEQCAASSVRTIWKYIPFSYNQESIEQAQQLSQDLGMDRFMLDPSDRFDEQTQHLKPRTDLVGNKFEIMQRWKHNNDSYVIAPKCANGREHYITADGHYGSCCYLVDHRFYYKNQFGKNKDQYDITKTTFSQILQQPAVVEFYQNLNQNPGCQYNCPKTTVDL
jgi:MoaA/NifB/PqqE/SkfB family radical SAM enzyme